MASQVRMIALVVACVCAIIHTLPCSASRSKVQQEQDQKTVHGTVFVDSRAKLKSTQKKLKEKPNSGPLHVEAALEYDALGDLDHFEQEIGIAMKLEPLNSMNYYIAYGVYQHRNLNEKKELTLDKAVALDPVNPFGHYLKGHQFEVAGNWQEALKEYETSKSLLATLAANPGNHRGTVWSYTDSRGDFFDVTTEVNSVDFKLDAVRGKISVSDKGKNEK